MAARKISKIVSIPSKGKEEVRVSQEVLKAYPSLVAKSQEFDLYTLRYLVDYCTHHHERSWAKKFAKKRTPDEITSLLMAAHVLEIDSLIELMCYTVARLVCGKTPTQSRKIMSSGRKHLTRLYKGEIKIQDWPVGSNLYDWEAFLDSAPVDSEDEDELSH